MCSHISNETIGIKIQFSIYQHRKKMQAQKGRTKSALLIRPIYPDVVRFDPIW